MNDINDTFSGNRQPLPFGEGRGERLRLGGAGYAILNDYEHLIVRGIVRHADEAGFPRPGEAGVEKKELEDYLYEYQRILDSPGSQKAQLTKYGMVAIVPVIVLSAFPESMLPWGKWSLYVGIAAGLVLALLLKGMSALSVKWRLRRLRAANARLAAYADRVEQYMKDNRLA